MINYDHPFISIIVPIYNVEKYLHLCLKSILSQSFSNYELILVDDGSNDGCPAICSEYASSDNRIKVIRKENGGLSDARNAGINIASGEYLIFIDGDDFIAEKSLLQVFKVLENDDFPDVLFLNAQLYFEDGRIAPYRYLFKRQSFYGKSRDEVLQQLTAGRQFHISACLKAVKRRLIIDNGIFFTKGIIGEDVDFSINLYLNAVTYSYLDVPYYFYRQGRAGSIMNGENDKRFRDLIFIISKWSDLSEHEYREDRHWIFKFLFHQYYVLIFLYKNISKDLKTKETKLFFKYYAYLLKNTDNKKALLFYIFYRLVGLNLSSFFIYLIEKE